MQAARIFVCALSEFPAGVQICQHQLDCRHFPFWMYIGWNPTAIVTHRDPAIDVNGHFYFGAKSCQVFIDGVIDDFVNQVMQSSLIGISDEHSWPFPNRFEAF